MLDGTLGVRESRTALVSVQAAGAGIIGAAWFVYLSLATTSFTVAGAHAATWWLPLFIVVVVFNGISLLWVAARRRIDLLAVVGTLGAIAYTVVLSLWFAAGSGYVLQSGTPGSAITLWFAMLPTLCSVVLVLARQRVLASVTVAIAVPLTEMVASYTWSGGFDSDALVRTMWSVAWAGVYTALAATAVVFADRLDAERASSAELAQAAAVEDAREDHERRVDALVHDRIIAFLLALRAGPPDAATRTAAADVLYELDHWGDDTALPATVDAEALVRRLRGAVSRLGDDVAVRTDVAAGAVEYPWEAVDALVESCGEAVRNFYRHGGPGASCVVVAVVDDDEVVVTVADDGAGFDPETVPAGRFGVANGIIGRMAVVPGGSASIHSAPGDGTRIRLRWERT